MAKEYHSGFYRSSRESIASKQRTFDPRDIALKADNYAIPTLRKCREPRFNLSRVRRAKLFESASVSAIENNYRGERERNRHKRTV